MQNKHRPVPIMKNIALKVYCIHICIAFTLAFQNNVCKNFADYYTDRDNNPNCYYNPTIYYNVPDMVTYYGYKCENYTVVTKDGYILTMFRIINETNHTNLGPPVLIEPGFGGNAAIWCNVGKKSLGFVLSDAGYDVWLGNLRGTIYSNKHLYLNDNQREYWNFTFTEMGLYDIPAQLDRIYNVTKRKSFFIGYSLSTSAYFVYNSVFPEEAKSRLRVSISLSPIAYVGSPWFYLKIASEFIKIPLVKWAINAFSVGGAENKRTPLFVFFLQLVCMPFPHTMIACLSSSDYTGGFDFTQFNPETLPIVTFQNYDAGSSKSIVHAAQLMQSGRFQDYDYGAEGNKRAYGSRSPPIFNLTAITLPNLFVHPHNDPISSRKNIEGTLALMQPAARPFDVLVIEDPLFSHIDFSYGKDASTLVYQPIVNFLKTNGSKYN